jgi:hypothetical protein
MGAAADTLLLALETAGTPLVVWSKPSVAHPVGEITPVTTPRPITKAAFLRSRRD